MKDSSKVYDVKRASMRFILMMGLVSLFGDMAYEGARSSTGAFMATLGASAGAVGFVVGFGELLGYAVRIFRSLGRSVQGILAAGLLGYGLSCVFPCSQWRLVEDSCPIYFGRTARKGHQKPCKGCFAFICHQTGGERLGFWDS